MPGIWPCQLLRFPSARLTPTVPLAIAAPAAVASLAYLNGRTQFSHDYRLVACLAKLALRVRLAERRDRINLFYVLEENAHSKTLGNRPFLWYEGMQWTFKEVYDIVLKYAAWLKTDYEIAPNENVALDFMNSPKFVFIFLALWSLGAIPVLINYNITDAPLLHCIKVSNARILFVDDEIRRQFSPPVMEKLSSPEFGDGRGPVEVKIVDAATEAKVLATEGVREPDSSRSGPVGTDAATLIYTSGTTGMPKPAIVSWRKIHMANEILPSWLGLSKKDIFYSVRPRSPP
jgi:acyl-CoA synthetase (AMP-forming)/AMP-acid ligase II